MRFEVKAEVDGPVSYRLLETPLYRALGDPPASRAVMLLCHEIGQKSRECVCLRARVCNKGPPEHQPHPHHVEGRFSSELFMLYTCSEDESSSLRDVARSSSNYTYCTIANEDRYGTITEGFRGLLWVRHVEVCFTRKWVSTKHCLGQA